MEEILEHNPREFNILNLAENEDSGHFNCPTGSQGASGEQRCQEGFFWSLGSCARLPL